MGRQTIPDIFIEQYSLGELDKTKETEILSDGSVLERVERIEDSNRRILDKYPSLAAASRLKSREKRRIVPFVVQRILPAAAVFAVLLIGGIRIFLPAAESDGTGIRFKGTRPEMRIYRQADGRTDLLSNNSGVDNYDLIQLSYIAGGMPYGAIISIDGNGTVTLHYPPNRSDSARLEQGGEMVLPYSYELDDAPAYEKFYFITSEREFQAGEILDMADQTVNGGPIPLSGDFQQFTITLKKTGVTQ